MANPGPMAVSDTTIKKVESNGSNSAGQQRPSCPERKTHGTTSNLRLPGDDSIGDGSRSAASVHSGGKNRETFGKLSYVDLIEGEFFVEVFSGPGLAAQAVRDKGIQAFEFDVTKQR